MDEGNSIVDTGESVDRVDNIPTEAQDQGSMESAEGVVDVWDEAFDMNSDDGSEDSKVEAEPKSGDEVIAKEWTNDDYSKQKGDEGLVFDKPILIKLKGNVTEISSMAEARNLIEMGLGATAKYKGMSEDRKTIQFMSDNNIDMDTLQQVINSRGDTVAEPTNNDLVNLGAEIGRSEYAGTFREVAGMLPDDVMDAITTDVGALNGFKNDITQGRITANGMREVDRLVHIKGMSFQDAYISVTQGSNEPIVDKRVEESRNTLMSQPKNTQVSSGSKSVWDMDDNEFAKYSGTR